MQPKKPRFNPLILALALAAVLMVWSVLGGGSSSGGMLYASDRQKEGRNDDPDAKRDFLYCQIG